MSHWEGLGKSDDWWTPPHVFEALGCAFDTDVAHPGDATCHVPASRWIMAEALARDWRDYGFVWMNPPFGGRNALSPWLDRFFDHGNGIALTPDRTSAPWFQAAWRRADAVLFTRKLRFLRPDGSEGVSPSNGTALFATGVRAVEALSRAEAAGLGILASPRRQPDASGYASAFFHLADMMGMGAQPLSPQQVWEEQMKPRLAALLTETRA